MSEIEAVLHVLQSFTVAITSIFSKLWQETANRRVVWELNPLTSLGKHSSELCSTIAALRDSLTKVCDSKYSVSTYACANCSTNYM